MHDNERYIAAQDHSGETYFCPIGAVEDARGTEEAIHSDLCVEAAVAGRYAGQIWIARK